MSSEVQPEDAGGPISAPANQAPLNEAADNATPPQVDQAPPNEAASGAAPLASESAPPNNVAGSPSLPKVERIRFDLIVANEGAYSFRNYDEFTDSSLQGLREALAVEGITTPMLAKAQSDGTFLLLDGHRRRRCVQSNIQQQIEGFSNEMTVPCHVLPVETRDLDAMKVAISANIQRQQFSPLGRIRAVMHLRHKGMSAKSIGILLGSSETTVLRDVALGSDKDFMEHVQNHNISATNAATLMKAAVDAKRVPDLKQAFNDWLDETLNEIKEEQQRREANDEKTLPKDRTWPQRYMNRRQVEAWKTSLESGQPLGKPTFKYKAHIKEENGHFLIDVASISGDLSEFSKEEKAKLKERFEGLTKTLEALLNDEVADSDEDDADGEQQQEVATV